MTNLLGGALLNPRIFGLVTVLTLGGCVHDQAQFRVDSARGSEDQLIALTPPTPLEPIFDHCNESDSNEIEEVDAHYKLDPATGAVIGFAASALLKYSIKAAREQVSKVLASYVYAEDHHFDVQIPLDGPKNSVRSCIMFGDANRRPYLVVEVGYVYDQASLQEPLTTPPDKLPLAVKFRPLWAMFEKFQPEKFQSETERPPYKATIELTPTYFSVGQQIEQPSVDLLSVELTEEAEINGIAFVQDNGEEDYGWDWSRYPLAAMPSGSGIGGLVSFKIGVGVVAQHPKSLEVLKELLSSAEDELPKALSKALKDLFEEE